MSIKDRSPHPPPEKPDGEGWLANADQQREAIIDRAPAATRAREQEQYKAEVQRANQFRNMDLMGRLAASPLSDAAIAQARREWGITE